MEGRALADDDRTKLVNFLTRQKDLLERLTDRHRPQLMSRRSYVLLRDAWAELQAERRFQEVEDAINSGTTIRRS